MKFTNTLLFILLAIFPIFAQSVSPDVTIESLQKTINKALKSYVFVDASGSGVVISPDGYVITNDHVAGAASLWRVRTSDGVMRYADLIGTDPYGDISLLKIRDVTDLPYIEMGDSDNLEVGQDVIAIGNPFGMGDLDEKPTITVGIISALHRFHFNYTDAIMTDAPLNPGNSGGPLITLDGKLIGINGQIDNRFQIRVSSGIGYAVSSNQIKRFLPYLKKADGEFVYHARLNGVKFHNIEDEQKKPIVLSIRKNSSLYVSGLRKGDEIISFDGHKVATISRLTGIVQSYPAHSVVDITLLREGETITVRSMLDVYPIVGSANLEISFYPSSNLTQQESQVLQVVKVHDKTPAQKAGIEEGDIIVSFAGRKLSSQIIRRYPQYLPNLFALYSQSGGALAEISVIRDGEEKNLVIEISPSTRQIGIELAQNKQHFSKKRIEKEKVTILNVQEGMFAARGGLERGDVILRINNYKINSIGMYNRILSRFRPGQKVNIKVLRNNEEKELSVVLGLKRNYLGGY